MEALRQIDKPAETMTPDIRGKSRDLPIPNTPDNPNTLFDAILYPNRSLPNGGFIVLMAIVITVNITFGIMFTLLGAWPILVFGGLDIFFVWLAFKISYRQGRLHERVRVTKDEILISRVLPSGHEMRWALPPQWTQISFDDPIRHESQVTLRHKGKVLIVGSFLSPKERKGFGKKLREAVWEASRN